MINIEPFKTKEERNYVDLYIKDQMCDMDGLKIEDVPFFINAVKVTQEGNDDTYIFIYQKILSNAIVLEVHNSDDSLVNLTNLIYIAGEWNTL